MPDPDPRDPRPDASMPRLLLVEDDELDRTRFARALRGTELDVELVECTSFVRAADALLDGNWRWVVTDFVLPDGSGRRVLELAREHAPRAAVVVLTGRGDETLAIELIRQGVHDYLSKDSLDPTRLAQALRRSASLADAERLSRAVGDGYRFLAETGAKLAGSRSVDDLVDVASRTATEELADFCLVDVIADEGLERRSFAHRDAELEREVRDLVVGPVSAVEGDDDDEAGSAVVTVDEAYLERLAGRPEALEAFRRLAPRHVLRIPLRVGDRQLGVMTFAIAGEADRLQILLLHRFADRVALALENARLFADLERAIFARDAVLAIVAHDLRNPLAAITAGVELLRLAGHAEEKALRKLDMMETAAKQMTRLVDDLVETSNLERGVVELQPVVTRPGRLLEDTRALVAEEAARAGVSLRLEIDEACGSVRADPVRLVQVLTNLADNAIRACPEGGTVTVSARPGANGGAADEGVLEFAVENPGGPIPEEEIPHLFEPFWQSPSRSRRGRVGLGLTIARGLVERQGGEIHLETSEERTRFSFTLPAAGSPSLAARS